MFYDDCSVRPDLISNVLSSINDIRLNAYRTQTLSIGTRTECEILSILNLGISIENLKCLDIFSYTPHISVGCVTKMQYEDRSFDLIICGWVLEFVDDCNAAMIEMWRTLRVGGYLCIGAMYHPRSQNMTEYNQHKDHEDRKWMPKSTDDIMKVLEPNCFEFIFKGDVTDSSADKRADLVAIVRKVK